MPRLVARIPLPGVQGRIDHLALDPGTGRLFVAALGNDTVEVVDLATGRQVHQIGDVDEPQGILFAPSVGKLFVSNGGGASLAVFAAAGLERVGLVALRRDPDNLRFQPAAGRVWVGEGVGAGGALAAVDEAGGTVAEEVPLDGHPESFQLDAGGTRIFVNVPDAQEVQVVDLELNAVVASWRLPCGGNFPMAIDTARREVLVGCRVPPRILALDAASGRVIAAADAPRDVDDIFIDQQRDRAYVSAGEGVVRVYCRPARGELRAVGDVPTRRGARTSLFDPESDRLYVAAPSTADASSEIQVFDTGGG